MSEHEQREAIAHRQAVELMTQWNKLKAAEEAAKTASSAEVVERSEYTRMLAEALKVPIGSRVSVTRKVGYKMGGKMQTKTYEVTSFALWGSSSLRLWGRTVKRDGSLGENFEIGTDWKRVE
jgi:hypothetical protein